MSAADNKKKRVRGQTGVTVSPVLDWARLCTPASAVIFLLLLAVFASAVSVVYATHRTRIVYHELQQLRSEQNEIEVLRGQLLIEQSTFGVEGRIERQAEQELDMKFPEWSSMVMVENE